MATNLRLVGISYDSANHEWAVQIQDSVGRCLQTLSVKNSNTEAANTEIEWYIEQFAIKDPFSRKRAKEAAKILTDYANLTISPVRKALLNTAGIQLGALPVRIKVEIEAPENDTSFHGIHWELLERPSQRDEKTSVVVSRYIHSEHSVQNEPSESFPDRVNILFLTARPSYHLDVEYRLLSKPLVNLVKNAAGCVACELHFVRPGTWEGFKQALRGEDITFSIVHLDMHGELRNQRAGLLFAPAVVTGPADFRTASEVGVALRDAGVHSVILNACKSAKPGLAEEANLAQTLNNLGIANVVGMSFSVMAHTASEFVRSFYRHLLVDCLPLNEAVSRSRQHLRNDIRRRARFGLTRGVQDEFVPVLYQSHRADIRWSATPKTTDQSSAETLPSLSDLTGRDSDILFLEECLATSNIVHISGPGGTGKTALAQHLKWWWPYSKFTEKVIHVSCRDGRITKEGSIFRNILQATSNIAPEIPADSCQILLQSQRWIIFLDDCEFWEDSTGELCPELLPTSAVRDRIVDFVESFQDKKNSCKLVTLSRTLAILSLCSNNDGTWAHTLMPMASADLLTIFAPESGATWGEETLLKVARDFELHDNNPLFAKLFSCSTSTSLTNLSLVHRSKIELPQSVHSNIQDAILTAKRGLIRDFLAMCEVMKRRNRKEYQILLAFAPFSKRISASMRPFLVNTVARRLIDCNDPAPQRYLLSRPHGFAVATEQDASAAFFTAHDINTRYFNLVKILSSCGFIEETAKTNHGVSFLEFNPMLEFLIRYEVSQQGRHDSLLTERLERNFLEYFEFRTKDFNRLSRDKVQWLCQQEWPNIKLAVHLCLDHPSFGLQTWNVVESLTYIALSPITNLAVDDGISIAEAVLQGYERWENFCTPPALTKAALPLSLKIVNFQCFLASIKTYSNRHILSARRGLDLVENFSAVHGTPDQISLCLKYYLECVVALEADMTQDARIRFIRRLILTQVPQDAPSDFQFFFYKKQADFLMSIIGLFHPDHDVLKGLGIPLEVIERKLESLFATMDTIPDSKYTRWKASMIKVKELATMLGKYHQNPADFSQVKKCIPIFRSLARAVPALDAMVNFIDFQSSTESVNEEQEMDLLPILQDALAHARARQDVESQVMLHKTLFAVTQRTHDYDSALEHHETISRLERSRNGVDGSSRDPRDISHEAFRFNELAAMAIQSFREAPDQDTGSRITTARDQISNAIRLAQQAEDKAFECMSLHLMAQWHNVFDKSVVESISCTTAAVMLGKEANEFCRCYFGDGKFLLLLLRVWDKVSNKDELLSRVASVIAWDADKLRANLDLCKKYLQVEPEASNGSGELIVRTQNEMLRTVL